MGIILDDGFDPNAVAASYWGKPRESLSRDDDLAVRTIIGEARGEGKRGWQAVAGVIRNRAQQSGQSFGDVVLAKNQFEPWGSRRKELESINPNSSIYQQVAQTVLPVLRGDAPDPTGGATHFYAPKAQAALGRPAPSWDNGRGVDIGNHRFFNLGYSANGKSGFNATAISKNLWNDSFDPNAEASDVWTTEDRVPVAPTGTNKPLMAPPEQTPVVPPNSTPTFVRPQLVTAPQVIPPLPGKAEYPIDATQEPPVETSQTPATVPSPQSLFAVPSRGRKPLRQAVQRPSTTSTSVSVGTQDIDPVTGQPVPQPELQNVYAGRQTDVNAPGYQAPAEYKVQQELNAEADKINFPANIKTADQAREYAKKYLKAKYPNGDFSQLDFSSPWSKENRSTQISLGTLKNAGVDISPLIQQKKAEQQPDTGVPTTSLDAGGTVLQRIRGLNKAEIAKEDKESDPLYLEAEQNIKQIGGSDKDVEDEYLRLQSNEKLKQYEAVTAHQNTGQLASNIIGTGAGEGFTLGAGILHLINQIPHSSLIGDPNNPSATEWLERKMRSLGGQMEAVQKASDERHAGDGIINDYLTQPVEKTLLSLPRILSIPGGIVASLGADTFLRDVGAKGYVDESTLKQTGKAITNAVLLRNLGPIGEKYGSLARLGAAGAGTTAIGLMTGETPKEAFKSGISMALLDAGFGAKEHYERLAGKKIEATDGDHNRLITITPQGDIAELKNQNQKPDVVLDVQPLVAKFRSSPGKPVGPLDARDTGITPPEEPTPEITKPEDVPNAPIDTRTGLPDYKAPVEEAKPTPEQFRKLSIPEKADALITELGSPEKALQELDKVIAENKAFEPDLSDFSKAVAGTVVKAGLEYDTQKIRQAIVDKIPSPQPEPQERFRVGQKDLPSNAEGLAQNARNAEYFKGVDAPVYSPDALRNQQAAKTIAKAVGTKVIDSKGLAEWNNPLGGEPVNKETLAARKDWVEHPDEVPEWNGKKGETFNDAARRQADAMKPLVEKYEQDPNSVQIVVSNYAGIKARQAAIMGPEGRPDSAELDTKEFLKHDGEPGAIHRIYKMDDGRYAMEDVQPGGKVKGGIYFVRHGMTDFNKASSEAEPGAKTTIVAKKAPEGKEPWQMTADEYVAQQRKVDSYPLKDDLWENNTRAFHKNSVKGALRGEYQKGEGMAKGDFASKPVPENVVQEYPDLAKEFADNIKRREQSNVPASVVSEKPGVQVAESKAEVFGRDEIVVSKPRVSARKSANGTNGEVTIEVKAPSKVTNPDNWSRLEDTNNLSAIVRGRLDFKTGKRPAKTDPVWSVWGKGDTLLHKDLTLPEAIAKAQDHVYDANPTEAPTTVEQPTEPSTHEALNVAPKGENLPETKPEITHDNRPAIILDKRAGKVKIQYLDGKRETPWVNKRDTQKVGVPEKPGVQVAESKVSPLLKQIDTAFEQKQQEKFFEPQRAARDIAYQFAGKDRVDTRQTLIKELTGESVPKAKAGIHEVERALNRYFAERTSESDIQTQYTQAKAELEKTFRNFQKVLGERQDPVTHSWPENDPVIDKAEREYRVAQANVADIEQQILNENNLGNRAGTKEAQRVLDKALRPAIKEGEFGADKTPMQRGKILKALDKKWNHEGKVQTTKQIVDNAFAEGKLDLTTEAVNRIKDMTRLQEFRATGEQQRAHEEKVKAGGKVTKYYVNGLDLGKTAYDYAEYLQNKSGELQNKTVEQPTEAKLPLSPELRTESQNVPKIPKSVQMFKDIDSVEEITNKAERATKLKELRETHGEDYIRAKKINGNIKEIIKQLKEQGKLEMDCP